MISFSLIIRAFQHPLQYIRKRKIENLGLDFDVLQHYNKKWFTSLDFSIILDVGAASGKHTKVFHYLFPNAIIHAFEPIPESYQDLTNNILNSKNIIAHNVALDKNNGEKTLNIGNELFKDTSSFYDMSNLHKEIFIGSGHKQQLLVETRRLDSLIKLKPKSQALIKIDTQGNELNVILGAEKIIRSCYMIIAEVSYCELYDGSPTFQDFNNLMQQFGFDYRGSLSNNINPQDGRILQSDCIFINKNY